MNNSANSSPSAYWLKHLPKEWGVTRLANVADILFSNVDKHTFEGEVPVRLCNYVDVYKNSRITNDIEFMDASADAREIERFQIMVGDVLTTKDSETPDDIAISALVTENLPGVLCGYHLALIRPRKHLVYGPYIAWLHGCKLFRSHYEANAVGVTRFGLSQAAFREARIPLPTLAEQRRIAVYLDKTCSAIDTAIEKKQKQLETLDALRKAIIHKAVTRGLDESVEFRDSGVEWIGKIPKHWRHDHLKRVCVKIQTGTTPPTANTEYYVDGTIPWYAPGCYDGGLYLEEPSKLINELAYHDNKLRLFPAESIFLVGIGATIGKVAMTKAEASCNQQITAIVCNDEVSSKYMTYQMKIYEGIIPKISQYTTLPIMDQAKIGYLRVAIPATIGEQKLIADYLDDEMSKISKLESNLRSQIDTLEQYRRSLLHECVTGKQRIAEEDM